jgi:cytochrome b
MSTPVVERACVWDRLVRILHWSFASLVLLNAWVLEGGETPHRWAGYVVAALVAVRLVWGMVGSPSARLAALLPTPSRLRAGVAERTHAWRGHNPMGALMVVAMWSVALALGLTGWLMGTDAWWGDETLENIHEGLANLLLGLAAFHVLAVVAISRRVRINLPLAMLTGCKERRADSLPFRD